MSSIGGVSSAGGAVGPATTSTPNSQAVEPATGAPDTGDFQNGEGSVKAVGSDAGKSSKPSSSERLMGFSGSGGGMSTQNFVNLHNSVVEQAGEPQASDFNMKKLIEMLMALKLLQEFNKSQ
jgi:hypothetical protein